MSRFASWLLLAHLFNSPLLADDWPQWGGPQRDFVSRETGLLSKWPESGPPLLWQRTDLGTGLAPVSVVGSRVYTIAHRKDDELAVALDRGTGQELWATPLAKARESGSMTFLRQRQPTVDGDRIYFFTSGAHLVCLEADRGLELWRKRYKDDFDGRPSSFNWCDYPLLDGDKLICTPGGKEAFLVALNKRTGEVLWKTPAPERSLPSHSPAVIAEVGGRRLYLQLLSNGLSAFAAEDGRWLWSHGKVGNLTAAHAAPLVRGDEVFIVGAYGTGGALLRISAEKAEDIYYTKEVSVLHGDVARWNDHIYLGKNMISPGVLKCLDWKTGATAWSAPSGVSFCHLIAEGRLYVSYSDGTMALVEASPKEYVEVSKFRPYGKGGGTFTAPVIADQRLFLRHNNMLQCYDLRREPRPAPPTVKPPLPEDKSRQPDAVFVATPQDVVERMLEMAKVTAKDVVYDLGSGDGRIVLTAARKHKARGIGVELDAELVEKSRAAIAKEGLEELVKIRHEDLFKQDLSEATVVTLYLLPHLNAKLLPQLERLPKGARIVAHGSEIPGVPPQEVLRFRSSDDSMEHTLYLWVTPLRRP